MNKPHKHHDQIVAWASGAEIECRGNPTRPWVDCTYNPLWNEGIEYRVKPKPEYPKTKMNDHELISAWENGPSGLKLTAVANAVIARAIEDEQVIIAPGQIEG